MKKHVSKIYGEEYLKKYRKFFEEDKFRRIMSGDCWLETLHRNESKDTLVP